MKKLSVFLLLTIASSMFASSTQASAAMGECVISIQPDGTVVGTDKISRNGDTYTLVSDISGSAENGAVFLAIKKDGVILDGAGHTIFGKRTGVGIELRGVSNVVIKSVGIDNFGVAIDVQPDFSLDGSITNSTNNQILNSRIKSVYNGIALQIGNNNTISGNTINSPSSSSGIYIAGGYGNAITDNKLFGSGIGLINTKENRFSGNIVDDKPIVILEGTSNQVVDGAAQVLLYGCSDITVQNSNPSSDLQVAIGFYNTNNSKIINCKGNIVLESSSYNIITQNQLSDGITLTRSHNNDITQNTINSRQDYALNMAECMSNNIQANTISTVGKVGIGLTGSGNNYLHGNTVFGCSSGIKLTYISLSFSQPIGPGNSVGNVIFANNITGCTSGISFNVAQQNCIYANNFVGCSEAGIEIYRSDNNTVYHNNFINNKLGIREEHRTSNWWTMQTEYYYSNDTWDNGYPSGGNYWSNYACSDEDGDGIGDKAYAAWGNHTDNYPLMKPYPIKDTTDRPQPYVEPTVEPTSSPTDEQPIEENQTLTQLPINLAVYVGIIALVTVGLMVYFKRRKRATH